MLALATFSLGRPPQLLSKKELTNTYKTNGIGRLMDKVRCVIPRLVARERRGKQPAGRSSSPYLSNILE